MELMLTMRVSKVSVRWELPPETLEAFRSVWPDLQTKVLNVSRDLDWSRISGSPSYLSLDFALGALTGKSSSEIREAFPDVSFSIGMVASPHREAAYSGAETCDSETKSG